MINAVKYKTDKSYRNAVKTGNTSSSTILQTHEPFRIVVFDDSKVIRRDMRTISRITEIEDITQIPTGNALLAINCFNEFYIYNSAITSEVHKLLAVNKIKIVEEVGMALGYIVEIPENMTFSRFSTLLNKTYQGESLFLTIEEDVIIEAQSCDYPAWSYNSQWHLADIQAAEAYELLDNGNYNSENGVTYGEWHTRDVAILDGHGFEFTHPDLDNSEYPENHPGRYMTRKNWDCVLNNNNPQPSGINDKHGTVMAGIAASGWADRRFLRGVGLDHINAQCLKIGYNISSTGTFSTSTSTIVRGLSKAVLNANCASIVMPYSQLHFSYMVNLYLERISELGRFGKGMPIFAAAGNSGLDNISNLYPAAHPSVMAIGASTQTNTKASFSNYGADLFAVAPGVSIFAIDRCCGRGYNINPDPGNGSVTYFTGTSAASVIAASIAATMVVANPNITRLEIKTILETTARRLGPYDYNPVPNDVGFNTDMSPEMGNGILTQFAAVERAVLFAEVNQSEYINYSLDSLSFEWNNSNNSWETTQPIPSGFMLRWDLSVTFTNTGSEAIPISQNNINAIVSVTLQDGGPEPIESTPMIPLSNFSYFLDGNGDFILSAGESVTKIIRCLSNGNSDLSCLLDGNYYFVAKIDSQDYIAETSEEDNIIYQEVEFVYDSEISLIPCTYSCIQSEPINVRLRIDNLTVTRTDQVLPPPYTGYFWKIKARFTNLDVVNANSFWVRYGWNPSIIPAVYEDLIFDNGQYINSYGSVPYGSGLGLNTPILPGQSRYIEKIIGYPPLQYPSIMTAVIERVNSWPINDIQSIHVTQSSLIFG